MVVFSGQRPKRVKCRDDEIFGALTTDFATIVLGAETETGCAVVSANNGRPLPKRRNIHGRHELSVLLEGEQIPIERHLEVRA